MKVSERQAGHLEGYAKALNDLLIDITGDSFSAKSYDPMTVDIKQGVMMSYAFDLKDGGRRHPLHEYESVDEITHMMRSEVLQEINGKKE